MKEESFAATAKKFNKLTEPQKLEVLKKWLEVNKAGDIVVRKQ